ncbi:Uncharacterized protein TCM_009267 [Theobroma cacao]|uniref:Uncharacterized protein n=1 Tax=Theobroma cacao TaxID=3641 RepID=A0A061E6L0_THECC|nr:Uncharacterized protein TCM_009267 [Theobroma cacao]
MNIYRGIATVVTGSKRVSGRDRRSKKGKERKIKERKENEKKIDFHGEERKMALEEEDEEEKYLLGDKDQLWKKKKRVKASNIRICYGKRRKESKLPLEALTKLMEKLPFGPCFSPF